MTDILGAGATRIDPAVLTAGPNPAISAGGTMRANNVTAWFGKHCIIAGVDLQMPAGSVTSIIGPSGCGKSTFIRTLNPMHQPIPPAAMAGEVPPDGTDIYRPRSRPAPIRPRLGMVVP